MSNQELATVKEQVIEVRAEVGTIRGWLKSIDEKLRRHEHTIYGNGGTEGLLSLRGDVETIGKWKAGWQEVTNYTDFMEMKKDLRRLVKQSYLLTAIIIIAVFAINILGPRISETIFTKNAHVVTIEKREPPVRYIYKTPSMPVDKADKTATSTRPAEAQKEHMDLYLSHPDRATGEDK